MTETIEEIRQKANKEKIAFFDWAIQFKEFSYWMNKYSEEGKE